MSISWVNQCHINHRKLALLLEDIIAGIEKYGGSTRQATRMVGSLDDFEMEGQSIAVSFTMRGCHRQLLLPVETCNCTLPTSRHEPRKRERRASQAGRICLH